MGPWKVLDVIDGDTIRARLETLPPALAEIHIRVRGVDTPERGAKAHCERERSLADQALAVTREQLRRARLVEFRHLEWDKYGGRVLADVMVDNQSLAALLVARGVGQIYFGQGPRPNWCFDPAQTGRPRQGA